MYRITYFLNGKGLKSRALNEIETIESVSALIKGGADMVLIERLGSIEVDE